MKAEDQHLRVAGENEPPVVTTVEKAVTSGSQLDMQRAMRLVLARRIDDPTTNPTALAALVNRLSSVTAEIEALEAQDAGATGNKKSEVASSNGTASAKWRPQAI